MKFLKPLLPILAATLVSAGIVQASFYKWSQTAATNATADSTINWAEGMAPSAVNDSARAMMAALAKFRLDTSGSLVLAGTSTAYTLATNQVFSSLALMDGNEIAFRPNVTSGAAPTLNVDGLGAKSLNQATTVAVATGALIAGAVYRAVYVNASNEWIVHNIAGQVPSGTTLLSMTACPTGWTISATNNDRTLVISSATAGTQAGTTAFSTYFSGSSVSGAHQLTLAETPIHNHAGTTAGQSNTHTHGYTVWQAANIATAGGNTVGAASGTAATTDVNSLDHTHTFTTDSKGSDGTHTHTIPSLQSVTVVACTKN